jgi:beta-hydroxyacyl-ACP dehydratase FabZ
MDTLTIDDVLRLLPHRYPFLLVDAVPEFEPGTRIVALKNVTANEPFFAGHFPGMPVMPGLLVVEALAQAGGLLLMATCDDAASQVVYFASLDNVVWHTTVRPGDQLRLEVVVTQRRGRLNKVHGVARVQGGMVCEADMAAVLADR